MGIIINIILVVVLAVVITGGVAYNNPQKAKVWAVRGLQKFIPELIDMNPEEIINDFKDRLPEKLRDIIDKNPLEEEDFEEDVPFPEIQKKEILGRPKKVVEFFCTSDIQCKNYFLKSEAQCETESGICFISQ